MLTTLLHAALALMLNTGHSSALTLSKSISFLGLLQGVFLYVPLHSDDGAFGPEVLRGSYAHPFN